LALIYSNWADKTMGFETMPPTRDHDLTLTNVSVILSTHFTVQD
jgi:hypothetical protein